MTCLHAPSRRELLLASGALFAWMYLPKVALAEGRDPRFLTVILRGALDGLGAVAPIGDRRQPRCSQVSHAAKERRVGAVRDSEDVVGGQREQGRLDAAFRILLQRHLSDGGGDIGDDAFHKLENDLDWMEVSDPLRAANAEGS